MNLICLVGLHRWRDAGVLVDRRTTPHRQLTMRACRRCGKAGAR